MPPMQEVEIYTDHPALKKYFREIHKIKDLKDKRDLKALALHRLIKYFAKQIQWKLLENFPVTSNGIITYVNGVLLDNFDIIQGIWINLPDTCDVYTKIADLKDKGLPLRNTLFQSNDHLVLWRRGRKMIDTQFETEEKGISTLKSFLKSPLKSYTNLVDLAERFEEEGPNLANTWIEKIRIELQSNPNFKKNFEVFKTKHLNKIYLGRGSLEATIVQYLLIRRLCDKIFKRTAFITSSSLSKYFEELLTPASTLRSPPEFLREVEPIIRQVATLLVDNDEKLLFLETLFGKFFPDKDKKGQLLHYNVATKKIFAQFLVDSISYFLSKEFRNALSAEEFHVLNPFSGSGYYLRQVLRQIELKNIYNKYLLELHGHERRVLQYFLSLINIECEYLDLTGKYIPYSGLHMTDSLDLPGESELLLYADEDEGKRQKQKHPYSLIIGETPSGSDDLYKGRKRRYAQIEKRVFLTYGSSSTARNKAVISDSYVKAIRWASDRILESGKGIVAFVCKDNFIEDLAFDGLRKHLVNDFDLIYILDIARPEGVSKYHQQGSEKALLFLIKNDQTTKKGIFFKRLTWDDFIKNNYLSDPNIVFGPKIWREIKPDKHHTWLTEGLQKDFESLLPMGTKISKSGKENSIFRLYGRGVATARDAWMYNFSQDNLSRNIQELVRVYNKQVQTWSKLPSKPDINEYLSNEITPIPWSDGLKSYLQRQIMIKFEAANIRNAIYRPFVRKYLYFDQHLIDRWYQIPHMLPIAMAEGENRIICVSSPGSKHFSFFITNLIPDLNLFAGASPIQCFPLYIFDNDGKNKRENITDWALEKFRTHYKDSRITKYEIFHYVYAVLHHPVYIRKYTANLRQQLPRIPMIRDFYKFATAGANLARLHLFYEGQEEYPLRQNFRLNENPDWKINKMSFTKDRRSIIINESLSLSNIPFKAFGYMIGNRSALEWIIEQYRLRSVVSAGAEDNPNRSVDPAYIVRLIGQVTTISIESQKIINSISDSNEF
jgi:predicted helicase